jgi:hypothetical protein
VLHKQNHISETPKRAAAGHLKKHSGTAICKRLQQGFFSSHFWCGKTNKMQFLSHKKN